MDYGAPVHTDTTMTIWHKAQTQLVQLIYCRAVVTYNKLCNSRLLLKLVADLLHIMLRRMLFSRFATNRRKHIIIIIIIIKDTYIAPFRHAPKALCKKKVKC